MKRCVLGLVLILILCLALCASAEKRGDLVVITFAITDNSQNAISARVGMEFNDKVFEFISAEVISADVLNAAPSTKKGQFGLLNMKGISTGDIGRVILRIKTDAPAGKYEIKPVVDSVYNAKHEPVELTVSGGRISIDHVWDNGRVTVEANCYTEGVRTYICVFCQEKRTETIPITEHREGSAVVMQVAKCTEHGLQIYPCEICHDTLREEIIPAFGHAEGETVVTQQPTCTMAGEQVVQCQNCGRTIQSDPLPPLAHTEVVDKAVVATCTTSGKTEGKHCSVCNVIIIAQTTILAKGHAWDEGRVWEEPGCESTGLRVHHCFGCYEIREEVIPATGHTWDQGIFTVISCVSNEKMFTCAQCEMVRFESYQGTGPHVWDNGTVVAEPNCTTDGETRYICGECGEQRVEQMPMTEHTEIVDEAIAATCTTSGKTQGTHCSVCNTVFTAQTSVPAKGHTWDAGIVTRKPTTTVEGVLTYTCVECMTTQTELIPIRVPGDADCDGKVSLNDALRVIDYGSGKSTSIALYNADVNIDEKVDIQDALVIMQYVAGWNVMLK